MATVMRRKRGKRWSKYWYCEFRDANGTRVQRCTKRAARDLAQVVADQWEREAVLGKVERPTVGELVGEFIAFCREQVEAGALAAETLGFYEKKAKVLRAAFGSVIAEDLTGRLVREHVSARRASVGDHTISKELGMLRTVLRYAVSVDRHKGAVEVARPRGLRGAYKPRRRWLTVPEVLALLDALQPHRRAVVAFCVSVGAEWGAVGRARRDDLDVLRGRVLVHGTKNENRERWVPLVLPECKRLLVLVLELTPVDTSRPLFAPWGSVGRDLASACRRAKIPHATPNDLRRTFATWLRAAGLPLDVIAAAMGHASSIMVERVYGRLDPAQLHALMHRAVQVEGEPVEGEPVEGEPVEGEPVEDNPVEDPR